MRHCTRSPLRGARIRLSAFAKTRAARLPDLLGECSGFPTQRRIPLRPQWTRAPLPAPSDWTRSSIVLEVPANADVIEYGFESTGGKVWADELVLESVDKSVPLTKDDPKACAPTRIYR